VRWLGWWAGDAPASPPAWQTWLPAVIAAVVVAVLGAMGTVAVKRMNRRLDDATTDKTKAESRKAAAETVSIEVATARALLSDVKDMMLEQRQHYEHEVESVRTQHQRDMRALTDRLGGIERAVSAHRDWDVAATEILRTVSPDFRDPPPLTFD
jgi:hypothetical protein